MRFSKSRPQKRAPRPRVQNEIEGNAGSLKTTRTHHPPPPRAISSAADSDLGSFYNFTFNRTKPDIRRWLVLHRFPMPRPAEAGLGIPNSDANPQFPRRGMATLSGAAESKTKPRKPHPPS